MYSAEAWARYSSMPGEVTMVVSDGRTMVTISQPMSVFAAVSAGVAPPPASKELANTGANLAVVITGGIVLMALAIILMPLTRRRMP